MHDPKKWLNHATSLQTLTLPVLVRLQPSQPTPEACIRAGFRDFCIRNPKFIIDPNSPKYTEKLCMKLCTQDHQYIPITNPANNHAHSSLFTWRIFLWFCRSQAHACASDWGRIIRTGFPSMDSQQSGPPVI